MHTGHFVVGSLNAKIQIHLQRAAVTYGPPWIQRLRNAISAGVGSDTRTYLSASKQIFVGALCGIRNGDFPLVKPRWDEHTVAPACRRCLHFKVTVHIVERSQNGGGNGQLSFLQLRGHRRNAMIECSPFWNRFLGWQQWDHRAKSLLLL